MNSLSYFEIQSSNPQREITFYQSVFDWKFIIQLSILIFISSFISCEDKSVVNENKYIRYVDSIALKIYHSKSSKTTISCGNFYMNNKDGGFNRYTTIDTILNSILIKQSNKIGEERLETKFYFLNGNLLLAKFRTKKSSTDQFYESDYYFKTNSLIYQTNPDPDQVDVNKAIKTAKDIYLKIEKN
jgi:hypothetical protein